MARAITIGNGNLLVGIDHRGQVRDLYFPYIGHANHVSGASGSYTHRIGVWTEGTLRWLSDASWHITTGCSVSTTVSDICAHNESLGVSLRIVDVVHNEKNVFLRKIQVMNTREGTREIKIFFGQEFRISESRRGDTAFYDPRVAAIIHYKGHNTFLVNAEINGQPFTEYSVGIFDIEGKKGTYTDAEDGFLSKNAIEHGSADSVVGVTYTAGPNESAAIDYWICAGTTIDEVHELHAYVKRETPKRLVASTEWYWNAWTEKESKDLKALPGDIQYLYKRSLSIMRVHIDNRGGIIASSDTDMLNQGRDTYSYVWPRDGAMIAYALDRAGYSDTTERYFTFIADKMENGGYLMHKYRVDGVLGSSWHPWIQDGQFELPIQEDETAIMVYMLEKHYKESKNLEFIESLYNPFVEPAADFMCRHVDEDLGLPHGSYDLWEEKFGTSTYTAAAVYGALNAAAELSALLGKRDNAEKYRERASLLKKNILTYLYDNEKGMFIKLLKRGKGHESIRDTTIDLSSFHGMVFFEVLDPFDKRIQRSFDTILKDLRVPSVHGGFMRYSGDRYYLTAEGAPGNAWCITTLWVAQHYIRIAQKKQDLENALELISWVHARATSSGILSEQVHPETGEPLGAAPLVWSHAEFVITVLGYSKKLRALG